jgi:hypothetical protein
MFEQFFLNELAMMFGPVYEIDIVCGWSDHQWQRRPRLKVTSLY